MFSDLYFPSNSKKLEEKLEDKNYPLEEYLKDEEAVLCVKFMGKNTKKYFNSDKIKSLIKLMTEEPEGEDPLRGHKFPYIATQILKSDCPFISKRFVLNEEEYDEEYPENNSDDDKEKDADSYKNDLAKVEKIDNFEKNSDDKNEVKLNEENFEEEDKEVKIEMYENEEDNKDSNKEKDIDVKFIINNEGDNHNNNTKQENNDNKEGEAKIIDEDNLEQNKDKNNIENSNDNEHKDEEIKNSSDNKDGKISNENNSDKNADANLNEKNDKKTNEKENKIDENVVHENNDNNNEKNDIDNKKEDNTEENQVNKKEENEKKKETNKNDDNNEEKEKSEQKEINKDNKGNNEDKPEIKDEKEKKEIKDKNIDNLEIKNEKLDNNENKEEKKEDEIENQNISEENQIVDDKKEIENINDKKDSIIKDKNILDDGKEEKKEENSIKENINESTEKEIKEEKKEKEEKEMKEDKEEKEEKEKKDKEEKEVKEENKEKEVKEENKEKEGKEEKEEKKEEEKKEEEKKEEKEVKEDRGEKGDKEEKSVKEESKEKEEKEILDTNNTEIKKEESNNNQESQEEKEVKEEKDEEKEDHKEQEKVKEKNDETDNIIIDNEGIDKKEINNKDNNQNINIDKEDDNEDEEENEKEEINIKKEEGEDSLSIEGEIDDFYSNIKKPKPKKKYENKPNNEYLDLLLNFVMNDKVELNYVLSGYFSEVMLSLIDKYPSQMLKYLYTMRKDAIKKIVYHSNQKALSMLCQKLLNIESFNFSYKPDNNLKDIISESTNFRNELIGDVIKSLNLEEVKDEKNEIKTDIDIEAKFFLLSDMINNMKIVKYLVFNNDVYSHLFTVLDSELYAEEDHGQKNDDKNDNSNNNFDTKYNIYGLFISLITKLLKNACSNYVLSYPNEFDFNCVKKAKNEITFGENMIITFGKILRNNFLPKRPKLVIEKLSSISYEGLGILNIKILELVKEMLIFMKELPKQFDSLLIRNNFCQRSIDYFFLYQWNNMYHIQFVDLFNLYLSKEENHKVLTDFLFDNLKFHEMLINYLNQDKFDEKDKEKIIINQKLKFNFKSGKAIRSGVYPHVIDLIYKLQTIGGLDIFTNEEKNELKIINFGEFEFSKDEKSNKLVKEIKISNNINNILKKSKIWNEVTKGTVIPIIKEYESKLYNKQEKKSDEESDNTDDNGNNDLINNSKKSKLINPKKFLRQFMSTLNVNLCNLPLSRNANINKVKNEKTSLREMLLNKMGYLNRKVFEFDENENNNKLNKDNLDKEDNDDPNADENKNNEENNKYNDSNYWGVKNTLPEDIKKQVDKKTNIIFNYNPLTYENNNKDDISEEEELLSIAMGLEQNEKMEKNKKIMYIIPGKLKPINLKAKTSPVQSIFTSSTSSKDNSSYVRLRNKRKNIINLFAENKNINNNEKEEKEKEENEEKEEEEESIVKNEENQEKEEDKYEKEDHKDIEEKKENNDDESYNDVNYWGNSSRNYLNEKEMEDCLKDL